MGVYNKNIECGGIIVNYDSSQLLIVYQKASRKWGLPKGHMNINEIKNNYKLECSKREVFEETGINLDIVKHYNLGKENMNNKLFYIYKLIPKNIYLKPEDEKEIGDIKWLNINDIELFVNQYACNRSLREFNKRKIKIKRKLSKCLNIDNFNPISICA